MPSAIYRKIIFSFYIYFVQKMSSADYVCCIYSNALQTNFIMDAITMNPYQIAPNLREQSDRGPYCLRYKLPRANYV